MTKQELSDSDTPSEAGSSFARLVEIMARLRAPGGCPWDAEQTHSSLAIHLLEEAHETMDAIDSEDMVGLAEELGDVLLQVVFHSEIAAELDHFDVTKVIDDLVAKLIVRHPHVFADVEVAGSAEVLANWEALKAQHKGRAGIDEGIPETLPSLLLAHKVLRRLKGAGRPYETEPVSVQASAEAFAGSPSEDTLGQLLMDAVALASKSGIDPEGALRRRAKQMLGPETDEV